MTVLSELYASGGRDAILHTLELSCASWDADIVLVRDFQDHVITTEDARELTALACGMDVAIPKRDASGAQNLTFAIDGVRLESQRLLRVAIAAQEEVRLTYRIYTSGDLSAPAESPVHFVVRSFKAQADQVQITAGLFDFIDLRWPRKVFDSVFSPCLKYMQ